MTELELRNKTKAEAISHWKDNLKRAEKLDWEAWSKCSYVVKDMAVDNIYQNGIPQIYGSACPYCQLHSCDDDSCLNCPLYSGDGTSDEYGHVSCCKEWLAVKRALLFQPEWAEEYTKEELLEAIRVMIAKLESVDNTLPEGEFEIQGRLDLSRNLTRGSDDE